MNEFLSAPKASGFEAPEESFYTLQPCNKMEFFVF